MMSIDSLYNTSDLNVTHKGSVLSPVIGFWILLIFSIPSMICSLSVLWLLLNNPQNRRSLNHRVIIIQLIAGLIFLLINVPLYLNYLRLGYVWPQIPAICQLGWFVGDGYIDTMTILMAWASFERHILIFHDRWILTAKRRFVAHYLPVTLIIIYCPFYYLIVEGFPPCENTYDYTENWCSSSCLFENEVLVMYDIIFNDILATILVAVFSISLIIRVLYRHNIGVRQRARWRRHRRIIIVFFSISAIYLLFNLPMMILKLVKLCDPSKNIIENLQPYFDFLNYFIFILYPFICLGNMSKKFCNQRRRRLVGPRVFVMPNRQVIQRQY